MLFRSVTAGAATLAGTLAGLAPDARRSRLLELVTAQARVVLGHAAGTVIGPERAFRELGLDSLTAVELRNRLAAETGLRLPATLAFDYPNVAALAEHLLVNLVPAPVEGEPSVSMLAEIDRFEESLQSSRLDASAQEHLAIRLRRILDALTIASEMKGSSRKNLDSATDDELFAILDKRSL